MYKRMRVLEEIDRVLEKLPTTPHGLAARLVREDRDSGWRPRPGEVCSEGGELDKG